jgi:magnesium chelatase family protein
MSLARVTAFALDGVDSRRVWVEADIRIGLPAFTIVGLADKAVREARERVRSAITNSGFEFPQKRITINLAPAYLRKIGPGFDRASTCRSRCRSWRPAGSWRPSCSRTARSPASSR